MPMPPSHNYPDKMLAAIAFAIFACCFYAAHLYRFGWFYMASDDSYIYLGYVRNWVERGELLTYNPGEPSLGTTGLLYYYLLSVFAYLIHFIYWPTPGAGLTLTAYLVNALLFIYFGSLMLSIWRQISASNDPLLLYGGAAIVLTATVSLPVFLWGWFGGLENPLSGIILMLLVERILAKAQDWQVAAASAMLGGCRPELFPIGFLVLALWVAFRLAEQRSLRVSAPIIITSLATFAGITLSIYLPCWLLTGSVMPSVLGTRVAIPVLTEPGLLLQSLVDAARSGFFFKPWVIIIPLLLAGLLAVTRSRATRILILATVVLAIYFLMRATLKLTHFSVQDRYVSFFWPLYVLMAGHVLQKVAIRFGSEKLSLYSRRLAAAALTLFVFGCLGAGFAVSNKEFNADVFEMNEVHVQPSLWMAQNLPETARIMIEPAGAIRVFTNFYLIDDVGLTTRHLKNYYASTDKPSYPEFLRKTGATHVFDYPKRKPGLSNDQHLFKSLGFWRASYPRYSGGGGLIGVYAVAPEGVSW